MRRIASTVLGLVLFVGALNAASSQVISAGQLMYIGTLDKKLLVFDEDKEEVVGQIELSGIHALRLCQPIKRRCTSSVPG